jgi:hypothetical protein
MRPSGGGVGEGHDRLPRLAEPHVVSEDGAAAAEQERDALNLMRKEPLAERDGLPVGVVQVVRREAEELSKSGGLCVELIGLRFDRAWGSHRLSFRKKFRVVRNRVRPIAHGSRRLAWSAGPP